MHIDSTVGLFPPIYSDYGKNLHIGKNVFINMGCKFQNQGGIFIGNGSLIGHNCVMATINHDPSPEKRGSMTFKPIHIGKDVWIGANVTITPGVKSAGSVLLLVPLSRHVASPFHRRTSNAEPTPYDK